ncbi:Reticulocyte-binding protein 2 a [Beauveria bassiana]|uniref:Mitochondrion protein, putative n=1 Tax=Beauveria bassiana (strain ARSEF 2860) TaxID=655819 RepID=J4KN76_BEAB2|nr:mitochondrion protein, putative [Beauveria bassiana ARSEF 2860]EJP65219.1 mitochondrion protein, putative [Beauveria bassiana ARSEF 2860]KAH8716147.1 Reticulocyte-binding protein 2 a [Beauveria bassiana]
MSAASRLTFLYPHMLRATSRAQPQQWAAYRPPWAAANPKRSVHALRRAKSSFAPRHGKGVAPETWEEQQQKDGTAAVEDGVAATENKAGEAAPTVAAENDAKADAADSKPKATATASSTKTNTQEAVATPDVILAPPPAAETKGETKKTGSESGKQSQATESKREPTAEETKTAQAKELAKSSGPLEAVLHMQPPEQTAQQHPSMSPPPYEHHFDSYSLVKQLEEGGYTSQQAIMSMKAIRKLLAKNLGVAQQSLVSKSDVENETYLFSAACSELNTEVKNNRRLAEEELRQKRTHLQHEVDILTQSLNQEVATLNDTVKGMYNDRKQAVREEQKAIDSAIQKISYKISIDLTSDAKTEIEGVRWVLIWRSVLGILVMAFLTIGTLRLATYEKQRKQEEERVRKAEEAQRRAEEARQRREDEKQRREEEKQRRKEEEEKRREEERRRRETRELQRREDEEELKRYGPRNGAEDGSLAAKVVDDVESLSAN